MNLKISRREFVKVSIAAAGYLASSRSTLGLMMGGGGCGVTIDPPVGGSFKDPVEMPFNAAGEVDLEAKISPVNLNGTTANLFTYNGYYPAPTIRVKKGDVLRVNLKNSLPESLGTNILGYQKNRTNLHTHGWHVSPQPPSDYVMYALKEGEVYNHVYDTSMQEAGTFSFYHPHKHGVSAEQYWGGLTGTLIVEDDPALPEYDLIQGYETHILVLKDITLSGSEPAPHSRLMDFMHGKEGNIIMVNGQVNPRLNIKAGQVQRWLILNASSARFYKLNLENHPVHLIGTDGGLLDKPYQTSEILLSPGERVDVLVRATKSSGNYRLRAMPYSRIGNCASDTITLMTVTYRNKISPAQPLPVSVNPDAKRIDPDTLEISARRTFTLSMGQGNAYINGQDFDVDPYTIHSHVDTYEIWTVINESGMDHPFHQHVNASQILSISRGDAGYAALYTAIPAWKDTVLVPKWGSVTMLVPVMDFEGMPMFHCHILEHEDIGMMGIWEIMGMM